MKNRLSEAENKGFPLFAKLAMAVVTLTISPSVFLLYTKTIGFPFSRPVTVHIHATYNIPTSSCEIYKGMSVSIINKYVESNSIRPILDH